MKEIDAKFNQRLRVTQIAIATDRRSLNKKKQRD